MIHENFTSQQTDYWFGLHGVRVGIVIPLVAAYVGGIFLSCEVLVVVAAAYLTLALLRRPNSSLAIALTILALDGVFPHKTFHIFAILAYFLLFITAPPRKQPLLFAVSFATVYQQPAITDCLTPVYLLMLLLSTNKMKVKSVVPFLFVVAGLATGCLAFLNPGTPLKSSFVLMILLHVALIGLVAVLERDKEGLLKGLFIAALFTAFIAIAQFIAFCQKRFPSPEFFMNPYKAGRPYGFQQHPSVAAMLLAFALIWLMGATPSRRDFFPYISTFLIFSTGLMATASRAATAGFLIGASLILFYKLRNERNLTKGLSLITVAYFLVFITPLALWVILQKQPTRARLVPEKVRVQIWLSRIKTIYTNPLGAGPGNRESFSSILPAEARMKGKRKPSGWRDIKLGKSKAGWGENVMLDVLENMGILGGSLFLTGYWLPLALFLLYALIRRLPCFYFAVGCALVVAYTNDLFLGTHFARPKWLLWGILSTAWAMFSLNSSSSSGVSHGE